MEVLLNNTLDKSENGEATVMLQLIDSPMPAVGALRRHEVPGVFELLVMVQESAQAAPFPMSFFFTGAGVARVMVPRKELAQKIVAPSPGGLIIPS
jgi:hypothetical protein